MPDKTISLLLVLSTPKFKILIFLVFLTGFLSDINILKSANLRFLIQIFLILLSLILLNTFVQSTKWDYLDSLLNILISVTAITVSLSFFLTLKSSIQ